MRLLGLIVVLGLGLIVTAIIGMEYTSRPAFCPTCHEMNPMFRTWLTSSHRNVSCLSCHGEPGVAGLIRTKLDGLEQVYRHVTNSYKRPITITSDTRAFSQRCLACHQDIDKAEKNAATTGPHNPKHVSAGLTCTQCHKGLVHNEKTNQTMPSRDTCRSCHGEIPR
ncbi:MAG: cytochrome c3 family protein [Bacillota bacterium]